MSPKEELLNMIAEHPSAKLVTDVGASMFSGWGELKSVEFHSDDDAIELTFD